MSKVHQIITDKIIKKLEQGIIPWINNAKSGRASNFISKKEYTGINSVALNFADFSCPYWATYKQVKDKGGNVKKGESGELVIFYTLKKYKNKDTGKDEDVPILKYYTLFNLEQCDNILWDKADIRLKSCDEIINSYQNGPKITNGKKPYYSAREDKISMPAKNLMEPSAYYSIIFHEMAHSTGHKTRLNRPGITDFDKFGSHKYSKEELIAEFSAAMLCATAGIENETLDNSVAYIQSWSKKFKNDPKLLIFAASQAQKAVNLILNKS